MRGYVVITLPAASLRMLKFFQLRQRNASEDPRLHAKTLTEKFVFLIKDIKNGWKCKIHLCQQKYFNIIFYSNQGLSKRCICQYLFKKILYEVCEMA